ncbi:hypothetical protein PQX77_015018 [Marasmius sp. AFHP31]|nr:hypothetical protein PQX77_015018 [Marasmius sp. AFHP31]
MHGRDGAEQDDLQIYRDDNDEDEANTIEKTGQSLSDKALLVTPSLVIRLTMPVPAVNDTPNSTG